MISFHLKLATAFLIFISLPTGFALLLATLINEHTQQHDQALTLFNDARHAALSTTQQTTAPNTRANITPSGTPATAYHPMAALSEVLTDTTATHSLHKLQQTLKEFPRGTDLTSIQTAEIERLFQVLRDAMAIQHHNTLDTFYRNFLLAIAISFIFSFVAAITLSRLFARSLIRPLAQLSRQVHAYVESNFTHLDPALVRHSKDEVGKLSQDIHSLSDKLSFYVTSLRQQKNLADEANQALSASRKHLTTAQRIARLGYFRWDTQSGLIDFSDELERLLQPPGELELSNINEFAALIHLDERSRFLDDLRRSAANATNFESEYPLLQRPRAPTWLRIHLSAQDSVHDGIVLATVQDISNQKAAEEQLQHLAYFDSLTGLASRAYLYNRLEEMIRSASRRASPFAVMLINLDGFRDINDALGHEAGDQLLSEVGERLSNTLRDSDFIARLGGDEFCVLLEHTANDAEVRHVAGRCVDGIKQALPLHGKRITPSACIGIARFPGDGKTVHALMQAAEAGLSAARNGAQKYQFYDRKVSVAAADRLALSQAFLDALKQNQFELHYQPQVSLNSGRVHAWEALARWRHPHKGLIYPADFIPDMEKLGLIDQLGNWVVNNACAQIAAWASQGIQGVCVSVNIAPSHLEDPRLVALTESAIDHAGISPEQLTIEITESAFQTSAAGQDVLAQFRSIGVGLAIDDFGTGYSSLGSLKHLPIDYLKIDRSFVQDMFTTPKDALLLHSIFNLGQALEVGIVAEGVEEADQIDALQTLGCDLIQGYFFSRPVPASSVPGLHVTKLTGAGLIQQQA